MTGHFKSKDFTYKNGAYPFYILKNKNCQLGNTEINRVELVNFKKNTSEPNTFTIECKKFEPEITYL